MFRRQHELGVVVFETASGDLRLNQTQANLEAALLQHDEKSIAVLFANGTFEVLDLASHKTLAATGFGHLFSRIAGSKVGGKLLATISSSLLPPRAASSFKSSRD